MRLFILSFALIGLLSCEEHANPVGGGLGLAGKAVVEGEDAMATGAPRVISWACGDDSTAVWTIFYGTRYRFKVAGDRVLLSEYKDAGQRVQYWTSEEPMEGHHRTILRSSLGTCGLWSEIIDKEDVVRIYRGSIEYWYWGTEHAAYYLVQDGDTYLIARVDSAAAAYTNWHDLWHRDEPAPEGVTSFRWREYRGYLLPVNFDVASFRRDFKNNTALFRDDRPYLDDSLCLVDDACADWIPIIALPEPVIEVRERQPRQGPSGGGSPPPVRGPVTTTTTTEVVEEEEEEEETQEEEEEEETTEPSCVPDPVSVSITGGGSINAGTYRLAWNCLKHDGAVCATGYNECRREIRENNCRTRIGFSVTGVSSYEAEWERIDNNGRCGPINPFDRVKVTFTNSCGDEQTIYSHCTNRAKNNSEWCETDECDYVGQTK